MRKYEMKFLQKIKEVTMFDELCNTVIQESLNIESLLLRIKRSQDLILDGLAKKAECLRNGFPNKFFIC